MGLLRCCQPPCGPPASRGTVSVVGALTAHREVRPPARGHHLSPRRGEVGRGVSTRVCPLLVGEGQGEGFRREVTASKGNHRGLPLRLAHRQIPLSPRRGEVGRGVFLPACGEVRWGWPVSGRATARVAPVSCFPIQAGVVSPARRALPTRRLRTPPPPPPVRPRP